MWQQYSKHEHMVDLEIFKQESGKKKKNCQDSEPTFLTADLAIDSI